MKFIIRDDRERRIEVGNKDCLGDLQLRRNVGGDRVVLGDWRFD